MIVRTYCWDQSNNRSENCHVQAVLRVKEA
jgi:hypothetical protein